MARKSLHPLGRTVGGVSVAQLSFCSYLYAVPRPRKKQLPAPAAPNLAPRKVAQQARAKATVRAILDATSRLLVERGYHAISTNLVARVAGVSIGSLYQYFPSKESLITALADEHLAALQAAFMSTFTLAASGANTPRDTARAFVEATLAATRIDPKLYRVLLEEVPRAHGADRVASMDARFVSMLAAAFAAEPSLHVRAPELAAFVVVYAMKAVSLAALTSGTLAPHQLGQLADELTHMFASYLTTPRG
jgi:AcrR family transcriptional regulator